MFRHPHASQEGGVLLVLLVLLVLPSRLVSELTEVLFILLYPLQAMTLSGRGEHIQVNKGRGVFPYKTLSKPIIIILAGKLNSDVALSLGCCDGASATVLILIIIIILHPSYIDKE